nr:hypothetical protein [Rhizoctonia sp.]
MSVAIGLLLSDGYFIFSGHKKNASLALEQSLTKLEYFFNVYYSLIHYCSSGVKFRSKTRMGIFSHSLYFFTRALPCFTELYHLFYKNGQKVVPENIITLLDPVALAHWISGDGEVANRGIRLCTDSFSLPEVVRLINVLIVRYDLDCSLHEKRPGLYRIYIKKNSMAKLRSIVQKHMVASMLYKIEGPK